MKKLHKALVILGDQVIFQRSVSFNDFFNTLLQEQKVLIFVVLKLQSLKAFAKITSTNFLLGKTFDNFVVFSNFQKFAIAKVLITYICKS